MPYLCSSFRISAETGGFSWSGLRGVKLVGNANNGGNAGSMYVNGNNGVGDYNVNWSAFLDKLIKEMSLPHWENISKGDTETSNNPKVREPHTCRKEFADFQHTHQTP